MNNRRLISLLTLNVALLGAVVVSVLTDGQQATGQTSAGGPRRYVMVAGERGKIGRSGGRESTVFVADMERGLVVALNYRQTERRFEPIGTRDIVRDVQQMQRRAEPRRKE